VGSSSVIDEGVIDRAVKGDKEAFSIIVRGSGARVLLVAERILRSPEEAISAVHSLFVIAFSSLRKLKSKGFLETWLLQLLVGVCGERLKEKGGKARATVTNKYPETDTPGTMGAVAHAVSSVESVSDRLSQIRARGEQVRRAVDGLPFNERAAVMFRDWDGVSTIEVAEILRTSREEVRKLLVNARKTVADTLEAVEGWGRYVQNLRSDGIAACEDNSSPAKRKRSNRCGKNSERLWLFVGGELGQTEQMALILHLEHCLTCQECLARASVILEVIREAAPVEGEPPIAPDKLWKEVEPLLAG